MADPYTNLSDELERLLMYLVNNKEITMESSGLILTTINLELKNIQQSMEDQLNQKILDWELAMGEEDKSLYSLGLRHALDVVTGVIPTDPTPRLEEDKK
jgi:hypothetical protein